MSLIDRAMNAASDMARASAASYQRTQRRRGVQAAIETEQQAIRQSLARIGRLALEADGAATPLPEGARPAAQAIRQWDSEIAELRRQLAALRGQAHNGSPPSA